MMTPIFATVLALASTALALNAARLAARWLAAALGAPVSRAQLDDALLSASVAFFLFTITLVVAA